MSISPFLSVNKPCDHALQWIKKQLLRVDLRVVQTFDLQGARVRLHDYPCPNHGTNECDCQMVVLLVYGNDPEPVTLILQGNDRHTWLSAVDDLRQPADLKLITTIQQALEIKAPSAVSHR